MESKVRMPLATEGQFAKMPPINRQIFRGATFAIRGLLENGNDGFDTALHKKCWGS